MRISRFRAPHLRRALLGAAAAGLLASLAGCGFHPLDARGPNAATSPELARIAIAQIPNRPGQIMRGELAHLFNPTGNVVPPAYTLSVTYGTNSVQRGTRLDDSAIRIDVTVSANFTLSSAATDEKPARILLRGDSVAFARKNNTEALYAAYVSEEEATYRAAKIAAEDIARQVSLYFKYTDRYPAVSTPAPAAPAPERTRPERP